MSPFIILSAVFFVAAAQANENAILRDQTENDDKNRDEPDAYESFGNPVYGASDIGKSGTPKSGYSVPVPPLPALPAAYSAYLNGLGYGSPYGFGTSYNRFGVLPYSAPYYGYGGAYGAYGGAYGVAPYNSLGLGYGAAPGYGYGAGLPYTSPLLGRAAPAYNAYGYGGLPYGAGLGYRFGGLGYNAAALRAPVAAGVPAPVPAPLPAALPAGPAYRPPVLPTQGKDGSYRYGYPPVAGQRLVY